MQKNDSDKLAESNTPSRTTKLLTAEETLKAIISAVTWTLNDIMSDTVDNDFTYGERTAYVDCLEQIQQWEKADRMGLDYNVANKYKI